MAFASPACATLMPLAPRPTRGEDHDPELHLIPLVLQVALGKREKVTIFGDDYPTRDGTCVRDYIHVIDLAQAHILALGALDRGSRFYNLGNGEGFTVKEVIDTAREITGKEIRADIGPRRAGDPAVLVAASDKIRKELGWVSQFPHVHEIIESAWRWHQANPERLHGLGPNSEVVEIVSTGAREAQEFGDRPAGKRLRSVSANRRIASGK